MSRLIHYHRFVILNMGILNMLLLLLFGCASTPQNDIRKKYENNVLKEEYQVIKVNGRETIHGFYKQFHANGKVKIEGTYDSGLKDGCFIEYDNTGNKTVERNFWHNNPLGRQLYYESSSVKSTRFYLDDTDLMFSANIEPNGQFRDITGLPTVVHMPGRMQAYSEDEPIMIASFLAVIPGYLTTHRYLIIDSADHVNFSRTLQADEQVIKDSFDSDTYPGIGIHTDTIRLKQGRYLYLSNTYVNDANNTSFADTFHFFINVVKK